jgi:hypothetical protein
MDTQLLSYRLKSARRKRRLVKEDRDKQLLKLDRERQRIKSNPDYKTTVPLDEAYQKGWKRLFVLKREVQQSDKAAFYQGILDTINTVQYHYDRSFKKPRRMRRWNKYYHKDLPRLGSIDQWHWHTGKHKLSEEQSACFKLVEFWDQSNYRWIYRYEFAQPDLFEIAVLPHIVDTIKVGDALLEQRLTWINDQFYKNYLHCRLTKLQNGGYNNRWKKSWEKLKYVNPLKNKAKWDWFEA